MNFDQYIINCDIYICSCIDQLKADHRGLLSQSILGHLRNFVEHVSAKIYLAAGGVPAATEYETLRKANSYVMKCGNLNFIAKFHDLLQISASHYTFDPESSERLMLKYYEYLLRIKQYMKGRFGMELLHNLYLFPLNLDPAFTIYHEAIAYRIENQDLKNAVTHTGKFYIYKTKPIFVNDSIYYEVSFSRANEHASKFERLIAFTKYEITSTYAVDLRLVSTGISVFGVKMPISIIIDWEVAIRACELKNFAKILNISLPPNKNKEYTNLMAFIKQSGTSLPKLLTLPFDEFTQFIEYVKDGAAVHNLSAMLTECRSRIEKAGGNVLLYLLYRLNNKIIKKQYHSDACDLLSELYLNIKCVPFDRMPYKFSLVRHNPSIDDILASIPIEGHKHELLARHITVNTEHNGILYTSQEELIAYGDMQPLVDAYNANLYYKHKLENNNLQLECWNGYYYIQKYEDNVMKILQRLKELSSKGIFSYTHTVNSWLSKPGVAVDSDEKRKALKELFSNSRVALVYGAAGTGKSTFINYISRIFGDKNKIYLANTNPAVENLRRKVDSYDGTFMTIAKFLAGKSIKQEWDLLFIDECSTVSNQDMNDILKQGQFKLLILVGDMYQIESILFGNWFSIAYYAIKGSCRVELKQTYRTSQSGLLAVWNKVRTLSSDILEYLTKHGYTKNLDNSIFTKSHDDEIILCLNYDGLYGINNINRFLQSNNPNPPVQWDILTYKVDDPILFNETERFSPWIYNNLKGKILGITKHDDLIEFTLEVNTILNELDLEYSELELCPPVSETTSVIKLTVEKNDDGDEDIESDSTVVPFQVAYAVSIHKAQGLEFQSVKVVITHDVEDMITHNIFYTAITRTCDRLQIYWSPETEKKVLSSLSLQFNYKDYGLLKAKYSNILK
ncbi:AAA family ATPase [Bacteroides salyersiae]|jgi:helicase, putative|uniref:ATP-dependent DNA helicase n=1 Tax=Bacteroides salyersiae TaxID=291644 RepID=UPI00125E3C37|nr:ATP-dependent RecD-like DNA helicase [Bacteroides salyersiae]KAB5347252.1 AAA family ATPase [Bacteroides salyersiae]KAB5352002.1 AAA family ATPase [Bacteroides salyersiae]KAB5364006.1 AAA family ATPase [Bacteroides salyersiae]KAB5366225.1 AAA family ATPase [Bacteroides salyersiae]KAB5374681.1 AAA family ATPase [Bacteroides salyersiae]